MGAIRQARISELEAKHKSGHDGYEYNRRDFVTRDMGRKSLVSIYEILPHRAAYPYHYHLKDEETFYILRGEGILKTCDGERRVQAGDLLYFPPGEKGAHKLINTSDQEKLVYIDFDVIHDLDVAVYPDSGKIGIWGKSINRVYEMDRDVDYFKGE